MNPEPPIDRNFMSGSYVILKSDFKSVTDSPPIWKIDGKALLQKYMPVEDNSGKRLYKNTFTYTSWSYDNRDQYYPAPITLKLQNRSETVIEFFPEKIKTDAEQEEEMGKFEEVYVEDIPQEEDSANVFILGNEP